MKITNEELLAHRHDPGIIEQIIRNNIKLVKSIANKFNPEDEDIVSEGMIGLIKAINKFDSTKNYKFSTYAYRYIYGGILDYYNRIESKIPNCHSLNEPSFNNADCELIDLLEEKENVIEQYEEYDTIHARKKFIYFVLDKECNDQDKEIFKMYLSGKSRKDITVKFGISRERARQVEDKITGILRYYIDQFYETIKK